MTYAGMQGTGPGEIAPDGSAVEFYAALPPDAGGAELVHGALPAGTAILELGAGAGHVTRPLAALGHPVTAVDESAAMLARIDGTAEGVRTVRSPIEELRLPERFGCVLMMSYLVNYGDRRALLDACRRHVAPGGLVVVQRETEAWHAADAPRAWSHDGVDYLLRDVGRPEPEVMTGTLEYRMGERTWTHTFRSRRLADADVPAVLGASGLVLDRFLDADGAWIAARPV
ncbi:class I SAM-dependent methyltransferase [Actinomadura roseirufa]|uniref:class I SAM-dependent methyltransferase n=1 Tax=Actinomadura roseirufa TaxID=2094049 RepID=UPI0010415EE3|nr:class I SAM-dependent methyltransferase [Actinomadura roseirufa]